MPGNSLLSPARVRAGVRAGGRRGRARGYLHVALCV